MTNIRHAEIELPLPDGLKVGDHFAITATLTITSLTQSGIDITRIGGPRQWVAGEDEADVMVEGTIVP